MINSDVYACASEFADSVNLRCVCVKHLNQKMNIAALNTIDH